MSTLQKVEGWLGSNFHDIYSKQEVILFLESIRNSLKEEEEERALARPAHEYDDKRDEFSILDKVKHKYQDILTDLMEAIKTASFNFGKDADIEIVNGNEIQVTVEEAGVRSELREFFKDNLPQPEQFINLITDEHAS